MKKIILFECLLICFDLLGQTATEVQKILKKEALIQQSYKVGVEDLLVKTKLAMKKLDFVRANNYLIEATSKLPLLNLSKSNFVERTQYLKELNVQIYLQWSDKLISNTEVSLSDLSLALENLEKAKVLSKVYSQRIKNLMIRVKNRRKVILRKAAVDIQGIIGLEDTLKTDSKGVARRKYLASIRFERGKVYFDARDYSRAIAEFEALLVLDPYNSKAERYLKRCYKKLEVHGRAREQLTIAQFLASSGWKWAVDLGIKDRSNSFQPKKSVVKKNIIVEKLKKKLDINLDYFRITNARVEDALDRLRILSQQKDEDGVGVNFVIKNLEGELDKKKEISDEEDPFNDGEEEEEIDVVENDYLKIEDRQISIDLQNIPIREILGYIVSVAKLKYKVEKFAVVITDKNDPGDDLSTDFFPASASFLEIIDENSSEESKGIKGYFESLGVNFPPKSQIRYISAVNRLVVTNTQENLRRVEELLNQLNIAPKQILVESKFIDIAQNDLDEVGFQWFFEARAGDSDATDGPAQDFIEIHSKKPDASRSRVRVSLLESGFDNTLTSGISSPIRNSTNLPINPFGSTIPNGEQLRVTTFLNKIRYDTLIRLLDQKESTNIVSAPKVSTTNGGTATLKIVQERYFPESWDTAEVTRTNDVTVVTPSVPQFAPPRDIGVTLEVTPQIDADGYSIQLQILPQIVEFLGYDTSFNDETPISGNLVAIRYDVPIISIRRIETNILLYDGETVTLGGLIREQIVGLEDKIPFISSIPLIGNLFKSKSMVSEKRNFLVFVSVRLISPSGVPIRPNRVRGLPDFKQL